MRIDIVEGYASHDAQVILAWEGPGYEAKVLRTCSLRLRVCFVCVCATVLVHKYVCLCVCVLRVRTRYTAYARTPIVTSVCRVRVRVCTCVSCVRLCMTKSWELWVGLREIN